MEVEGYKIEGSINRGSWLPPFAGLESAKFEELGQVSGFPTSRDATVDEAGFQFPVSSFQFLATK